MTGMTKLSTVGGAFGWLGSPFVKTAVDEIISLLKENSELQSSVKTNLERLKDSLVTVQSVVEEAEEQQIQDQKLNDWLLNLKEIAYQADDLIDTFKYLQLQEKVEGKSSVEAAKDTVKRLLLPDDETKELDSLVERLERHASNVGNFIQLLRWDGQSQKHVDIAEQRTTSCFFPVEHSFVGRFKEKKDAINILLTTEQRDARNVRVLPVLPILGIGGVGKTTLAQVVYNDEEVEKHFSLKMWVCVSENFDVFRLTKEILDNSGCEASEYRDVKSLNRLQEILKKTLSSKKFLLVLDDIWNETEETSWVKLKAPLCYAKDGSMILLTSRLPKVAKLMGTVEPIELEGLPEDEYWSFFKEQSFRGANPEKHPRLVAIGKEIALKLKGSPLAAKTMGPLLNENLDADHWESISKSKIWELEKGQDGIMAVLRLSYLHLAPHLRQCFAYLSIYPKDWGFKRDYVIRMWMAQGMIHLDSRTKRIEDVGKDYFNELISKSFFQPVKYDNDMYTIHDLLHDLAESVSKNDCFRIDGNEFRTIPSTIRHLYLNGKHLGRLKEKENTAVLEKLRTLILYGNFFGNPNDPDLQYVLIHLKKIRLLVLRRFDLQKCSDNLSSLIHLRYLDLPYSGSKEVPEELPKLYHLQTLVLSKLSWDCVPSGIANLINLRHFIGGGDDTLSRVPGIGKLTCLQKLSMFRVQRDPEFQIGQLKYLRELCGRLTIQNLDCVDSKEEAKEANLCDKRHIEELCLVWDEKKNMKPDEVENGILEDLCPNPNLKWLTIDGYRGTMSPRWMVDNHSFTKLEKLEISKCRAWKELPPLGQLKLLKSLKICGMNALKKVGTRFHGENGFPSLESLILEDFSQWEEWSADKKVILFPCLNFFRIKHCPGLQSIPPIPTTLEKLEVEDALMAQCVLAGIFGSPTVQVLLGKTTSFLENNYMLQSSVKSNLKRLRDSLVRVQYILAAGEKQQIQHETLYKWLLDLKEIAYQADDLIDTFKIQQNVEATTSVEAASNAVNRLLLPDDETKELSLLVERLERHASNVGDFFQFLSLEEKKDINILRTTERPNQNLKWLKIDGYRGTLSPSWMVSLTNLVSLRIYNCKGWEKLPPLGQLLWLKYLKICGMDAIKEVGTGFHGQDGFPSLERLVLKDFPLWEEWSADENVILFPRLQFFQIKGCPRLKSIPPLPTTLKDLELEDALMAQCVLAGIFGSPTVQVLLDKTTSFLEDNYMLQSSVKSNLKRLRDLLLRVQYLEEAEKKRQIQHETLYHWLLDFKEIAYQADDLINTFEIQQNVEAKSSVEAASDAVKRLLLPDDEIKELKSLVERLERSLKLRLERLERHVYISSPVGYSFVGHLKEKKDINILGTTERPNQNLKWLKIDGYSGTLSPSWMVHKHSLTNLVSLRIYNCRAWEKLPPLGQLLWLRYLTICGMDAVKEVGTGFHGKDGFRSLERLVLKDIPLWEEWSADEKVIWFPRLQFFQIKGCQRLKSIPPLPTTLEELDLENVGLTILPKLQMASSCPSNSLPSSSTASSSSSLKTLTIIRCIALNQVGEWFMQHHNDLRHLEVVRNYFYGDERNSLPWNDNFYGDERKSLSLNGFSKLIALHTLEIGYCNIFVTSGTEEDSGLLFPSLKYLHLQNCFVADNIMSKCLQGLSSLDKLKISRLPKIMTTSFAKGLQQLTRLKMLDISDCEELWPINSFIKSLKGSLEELHISNCPKIECLDISGCKELRSIRMEGQCSLELHISGCPKITKITSNIGLEQLAQLKRLLISHCEELSSLPSLEGLSSLEVLNISDCEELSSLPSLKSLCSLEELNILGCPKITSIIGLKQLTKLKTLQISGCKELSSVPCLEALLMLQLLLVDECPKITIITGLEQLTELKWIEIRSCKELSSVPGLEALPMLTVLEVDECPKLNSEEVEGIRRIRTRTERWYE